MSNGLAHRIARYARRKLTPCAAAAPPVQEQFDKAWAEVDFWRGEIERYTRWYQGDGSPYGFAPPSEDAKIKSANGLTIDALDTWLHRFQTRKYLYDLSLPAGAFRGKRVLDVGCGPFPNLLAFEDCIRIGVDPLVLDYEKAGFPLGHWSDGYTYCRTRAETLPFPSKSIDVVISVNAIDHVDDFAAVAVELRRVLRPGGVLQMHVHYHARTTTEPIELNDEIFLANYSWVAGLKKKSQGMTKDMGGTTALPGETYVVWGNA